MGRFSWAGVLAVLAGLSSGGVRADVVTLTSMRDNTLIQLPSTAGPLSNGAGASMFVGRTRQAEGEALRRGLMAFDLSSIAPGSQINSVSLTLHVVQGQSNPGFTISLFPTLAAWGEGTSATPGGGGGGGGSGSGGSGGGGASNGAPAVAPDATWFHRQFATEMWTAPGGDFDPLASASATINSGAAVITWSGSSLVEDVQAWVDNPNLNFGWLFKSENESLSQAVRGFGTHEHLTLAPQLAIDFTPVPEPGSLALLGAMAAGAAGGAWRRRKLAVAVKVP